MGIPEFKKELQGLDDQAFFKALCEVALLGQDGIRDAYDQLMESEDYPVLNGIWGMLSEESPILLAGIVGPSTDPDTRHHRAWLGFGGAMVALAFHRTISNYEFGEQFGTEPQVKPED